MIELILADDHDMFLEGLVSLLEKQNKYRILGVANNGERVIELLEIKPPQVLLLDINMPVMNGINVMGIVRKKFSSVKVIVLTMHNSAAFVHNLLRMGAAGYILKNTGIRELNMAIDNVMAGGTFFSTDVAITISKVPEHQQEDVSLTRREIEIIKELANGLSTKEIAEKLFLSIYTIETHRKNILNKLGLNNVAELIHYAAKCGLL
jgi:DNA-binding NarL/FixJ family response regulator